jgi:8-oxo-dGTP pyrophosphatase MutT (NUDIX family)
MNKKTQDISIGIYIRPYPQGGGFACWVQERKFDGRVVWEFPGGKREKEESPLDCVLRELLEETGSEVEKGRLRHYLDWKWEKSELCLYLSAYLISADQLNPQAEGKWVDGLEFTLEMTLPGNKKLLKSLHQLYTEGVDQKYWEFLWDQ